MSSGPESSAPPIRVLLVDDHKMIRVGLRELLADSGDIEIVGEAGRVVEAVEETKRLKPDVVLLDYKLPDGDGVETCRRLKTITPPPRVLMLTSFLDQNVVSAAIANGADGYVLKEIDGPDLAIAIRRIHASAAVLDPRVTRHVIETFRAQANPLSALTAQERRLLSLVAEGKSNKEIGLELGLADKTVRNYFSGIMNKLRVARRAEAIALFIRHSH